MLFAFSCVPSDAAVGLATAYVSPGASGDCTAASPCGSIQQGLATTKSGGTILLASGKYPTQVIHDTGGRSAHFATNVVVRPASGANPVVAAIVDYAPHLTFSNLRVDATSSGFCDGCAGVNITSQAPYSQLVRSHLTNATVYLRGANVAAVGNEIGPSQNYDGIDVGDGANRVVITGNHIHDLLVGPSNPNNVHVDCLQIYDASSVSVTSNWFDNCTDRDLIFSPGRHWGVTNVTVANNFIRGCVTKPCQGSGITVDARTAPGIWDLTNLAFVSNTVVDGGTLIGANDPGLIFRDNIIGFLANCISVSDYNLISAYNTGLCKDPRFLGASNRVGDLPGFVNRAIGDLHLTRADSRLQFAVPSAQPTTDIDGLRRCQPSYVGAHDFCARTVGSTTGKRPPSAAPPVRARPIARSQPGEVPGVVTAGKPLDETGVILMVLVGIVLVASVVAVEFFMRRGQSP